MRHRVAGRHLGRTSSHRRALRRALIVSLFRHESITTTPAKAKEVRAQAERLITRAKKGGLANYRRALAELQDKAIVKKLFNEIAPRYADRPGGYTRILRLSHHRVNDGAEQVIFELVGEERRADRRKKPARPKLTARRQRRIEEEQRAKPPQAPAETTAPEEDQAPAAEADGEAREEEGKDRQGED